MASQGSSEPHSCQYCQQLIFYLPSEKSSAELSNDFEDFEVGRAQFKKCAVITKGYGSDYYLQLEISCYHFSKYIASGCKFFELLSGAVPKDRPYYAQGDEELVVVVQIDPTHVKFGTMVEGRQREGYPPYPPTFQLYDNLDFAILTKQGDPASHWIGKGPNNIIPSSNESFNVVRGWLKACLDSHDLCLKPETGFMPARLIKILENGGQFTLSLTSNPPLPATLYTKKRDFEIYEAICNFLCKLLRNLKS
ncbi:hypothetical protein BKA64DRAFT_715531 [Cadophora sp. MPI-SDFR-AT-0126]|nr:hypothetical protein BKA64DRAFT_715531 [Leotiomycetes sp. MPI-SDFR-AT-0126]